MLDTNNPLYDLLKKWGEEMVITTEDMDKMRCKAYPVNTSPLPKDQPMTHTYKNKKGNLVKCFRTGEKDGEFEIVTNENNFNVYLKTSELKEI